MREFTIPNKTIKIYEDDFTRLITSYCLKKESTYQLMLPSDEITMFKHIMSTMDPAHIKKWTKTWLEETSKRLSREKNNSKGGLSSWLFGGGQGQHETR